MKNTFNCNKNLMLFFSIKQSSENVEVSGLTHFVHKISQYHKDKVHLADIVCRDSENIKSYHLVMILSFQTDRSGTQCRPKYLRSRLFIVYTVLPFCLHF